MRCVPDASCSLLGSPVLESMSSDNAEAIGKSGKVGLMLLIRSTVTKLVWPCGIDSLMTLALNDRKMLCHAMAVYLIDRRC